jgi:predicted O-methyltransferase YrrM
VLPILLDKVREVDLVFVDGNHRLEPTLRYFEWILNHSNEHTIIIFDDIHWSEEMELAWKKISQHPTVTCTIDLFFLGLVFFKKEFKSKQNFVIRF